MRTVMANGYRVAATRHYDGQRRRSTHRGSDNTVREEYLIPTAETRREKEEV